MTDTIEGTAGSALWYHYDVRNDVLYLQFQSMRDQETFGEETPDGFIVERTADGKPAGMTIINWWKRFGQGQLDALPLRQIEERVEQWSHRIAA